MAASLSASAAGDRTAAVRPRVPLPRVVACASTRRDRFEWLSPQRRDSAQATAAAACTRPAPWTSAVTPSNLRAVCNNTSRTSAGPRSAAGAPGSGVARRAPWAVLLTGLRAGCGGADHHRSVARAAPLTWRPCVHRSTRGRRRTQIASAHRRAAGFRLTLVLPRRSLRSDSAGSRKQRRPRCGEHGWHFDEPTTA